MQLLQDEFKESNEQQTNVIQDQHQPQSPQSPQIKMDKFYPPKPKINSFNELFTCFLCQGYMINPTTIDICSHTYCRSCIVRHLSINCCCPQCGKTSEITNLLADHVLRSIIFKMVPGLYQRERESLVQFINKTKSVDKLIGVTDISLRELLENDDDIFAPTDPISLSLEFHPLLAQKCPEGSVPIIRYLQCPASVKVQHLKRFLYSKFEIDPCNQRVVIDVIYEDEILPNDFTLMDIGYCYNWQRHAPLKLCYRILIYNGNSENSRKQNLVKSIPETSSLNVTVSCGAQISRISGFGEKEQHVRVPLLPTTPSPSQPYKSKSLKSTSIKHMLLNVAPSNPEVPVKVTFSRKPSENKKTNSRKSSSTDEFLIPTTTNDFKSLRSNDIRFSNYAITSSTTNTINTNAHITLAKGSTTQSTKREKPVEVKEEKSIKCDIVVSIPHNQMHEEWETKPLAHLKTASKKSPNSHLSDVINAAPYAKKVRNVPKLKIELNSLKTKLIEKPKSADIRLDALMIKQHHRPRKCSLDDSQPVVDKVDLETYVKNIGLKPIEIQTSTDKHTPNASPMSSSSSTTSSSTSNFNFNCNSEITSSSSHKKRKKKHSKDSRESKDSKRKKMHAEISSHSAQESLKMKVKLTPPINLKSLKSESKKSSGIEKVSNPLDFERQKIVENEIERNDFNKQKSPETKIYEKSKEKLKFHSTEIKKSKSAQSKFFQDIKKLKEFGKSKPLEIKIASSNTSNKSLAKEFDDEEDLIISDSSTLGLTKSLAVIKESKLPHSPPLPPSLFKTTPLTFSTFSPNVTTMAKPKPIPIPKDYKDKPKTSQMKPIAPKPIAAKPGPQSSLTTTVSFKSPQFLVPNPPRFMTSNSTKFLSTPTSIASSANKHMGHLLKRSISLDDNKNSTYGNKQQKLEKPNQITVSAYDFKLHMTKLDIPATPTSSTAKSTYEIPLYSPLSASYNPKCSFSVNSTTSAIKSTKTSLNNPITSSPIPAKHTFTANPMTTKNTDAEIKKATTNTIKPSPATTITNMINMNNKTPKTSMTTLMGPPMPMQKFNSKLTVVPTAVKSPPLSTVMPFVSSATLNNSTSLVNFRQNQVLLIHSKPINFPETTPEKKPSTDAAETIATVSASINTKTSVSTTNGLATEKPKSSLRQFRLPSRESGQDILDLSATTKPSINGVTEKQSSKPSTITNSQQSNSHLATSTGSSLERALNKIKQNMTTTTTTSTTTANTLNNTSSNSTSNLTKKPELLSPISDDLQNLHLLSESATAREKIAISTNLPSSSTYLYEKAKIIQNTLVRQQNASVRNIPNPSALAFRNQQPTTNIPPMVTIAAGLATNLADLDKPLLLKTPSPPKSPNCNTSSISPSRNLNKKHPSIDQVAASLNQRASAAAEALKQTDETGLVSSTSSPLTDKLENKEIKQESADIQIETNIGQPSSTVNTCTLVDVLDIKKEPEEKVEEATEIQPSEFIKMTPKKATMVENLVTSVINVTTPSSTLLTATTASGF